MTKTSGMGRAVFALAVVCMGIECLIRGNPIPGLEPVAATGPLVMIGMITGVVLVVAAIASMIPATARYGAMMIALFFLLLIILLHIPKLIASPKDGGEWTVAFESLALMGAALVMLGVGATLSPVTDEWMLFARRSRTIGRYCYGLSFPVFAVLHFVYTGYVASVIPSWLPAHTLWAYATGVAHAAAGVSIVTGILGRIGSLCTALMFGSWVLILHGPRVATHMHAPDEWGSMLIALAMCGGALLVADLFAPRPVAAPEVVAAM